jgi:hypothetical protein
MCVEHIVNSIPRNTITLFILVSAGVTILFGIAQTCDSLRAAYPRKDLYIRQNY